MSFRAWLYIAVFGIALAGSGQAQDSGEQPQQPAAEQQELSQSLPIPVPIVIVESEETSEAREGHEAEARQREIEDLRAQQGMDAATQAMNEATQSMALYALLSTVFVAVGTFLLFWTLYLTRKATRSAEDAVLVTRDIGEAQVRAYLTPSLVQVSCTAENPCLTFRCNITNHGQSPASDAFALVKVSLFIDGGTVEHKLFHEIGEIPTGQSEGPPISYTDAKISHNRFKSSCACHIQIKIIAHDVFKKRVEASRFFMAGGHPQNDVAYMISKFASQIHYELGTDLEEADFAHLVPNWRKPNWGKVE
ncbi:hypothetical protein [uncultured Pseudophaeobacter sp.]|jgi:hypothetical protein|uniref:hypothetical protein n=1 Tax=uncultured Pseudophaeobacter sp. TaxID=1759421 RepID=UPI0025E46CDD|nr:hypothetical protein [uncultured Pseudophaeobacter sp.]